MTVTQIIEVTAGHPFLPSCNDCEIVSFDTLSEVFESGSIRRSDVIIVDCDFIDFSCSEMIEQIREESGRIKIILTGDFIPHLPPDKIPEIFFLAKKPITEEKMKTIIEHISCKDCPTERRREPRFNISVHTEISGEDDSFEVSSANLSLHGIQLVFRSDQSQSPPAADEIRNLKIRLGEDYIELPGVIRYSTEGKTKQDLAGLEFQDLTVPSVTKLFAFLANA